MGEVIGNRLVSATKSLSKFLDTARTLPSFEPARGYSYIPQSSASKAAGPASTTASTPSHSREGSVVPGADTQSLRSGSLNPESASQSQGASSAQDITSTRLLASSLQQALEFSSEYMDENPLLGTPGNFSFTHSTTTIKKRTADEAAAQAAAAAKARMEKEGAGTVEVAKAPSPPAVMSEAKAGGGKEAVKERERDKDRRGSKMEKIKRKKSKANNALTPGAGASNVVNGAGSS